MQICCLPWSVCVCHQSSEISVSEFVPTVVCANVAFWYIDNRVSFSYPTFRLPHIQGRATKTPAVAGYRREGGESRRYSIDSHIGCQRSSGSTSLSNQRAIFLHGPNDMAFTATTLWLRYGGTTILSTKIPDQFIYYAHCMQKSYISRGDSDRMIIFF